MSLEGHYNDTRSILKMVLKSCSKAIFASSLGHGKSPCFLHCDSLQLFGVDGAVSVFASVDGANLLECAF
jgi:hypothetical protein